MRKVDQDSVTADDVRNAVAAAGITRIDHHDCCLCGYMTAYVVGAAGRLFFDPGCYCSGGSGLRPSSWDEAADYINRQSRTGKWGDVRARVAATFHIELPSTHASSGVITGER